MPAQAGRTPLVAAMVCLLAGLQAGCAPLLIFNPTLRQMAEARRNPLPTAAPQDAIELEVFFIERPGDDPRLGESMWTHLDQIGSVDAATRQRLTENGLRFGLAGQSLPYGLQALLSDIVDQGPGRRTQRQVYQTPSGVTHQFPSGDLPNPVVIRLHTDDGIREREYLHSRGVIRCRATRTQAGWAELEVLPEIHHGQMKMRPIATEQNWNWSGRQEIEPHYSQRFRVTLNQGDLLVLSAVGEQVDSLGNRMFRTGESGEPIERLLVIRVRSLNQVEGVLQGER
ncbi:MAG: hypothetical protein KDA75_02390 [Planctomycetaceae bacterium]|nr:hypothetical protein [Planctomycetaceae bacterium]